MAALLIGMSIMAVLMSAALPVWSTFAKREREEELIWRGNQYARAVGLFQRKYANTFPPNLEVLIEQRFLRKKYKDPITNDDFQIIPATGGGGAIPPSGRGPISPGPGAQAQPGGQTAPGLIGGQQPSQIGTQQQPGGQSSFGVTFQPAMGIQGVTSKSKDQSIKIYNGRSRYNEWAFVYLATAQRIGVSQGEGQQGPGRGGIGGPPQGTDRRPGVGGGFDGRGGPFDGRGGRGQPPFGPGQFGPRSPGQQPFGPPFGQPTSPPQPGQQPPLGRPPFGPPPSRPPGN